MRHHIHVRLRVGALTSSLLLLAGFVAVRTGWWPLTGAVTHDPPNVSHELNRIDFNSTGIATQFKTLEDLAKLSEIDHASVLDVDVKDAGAVFGLKGDVINSSQIQLVSTGSDDSPTEEPALTKQALDELRRRPGPASPILIRHDALALMAGSESIVNLPKTPAKIQNAIDNYMLSAAKSFSKRDRNGDGMLTEGELDGYTWQGFSQRGAVVNDAIDSDGFLKHFYWFGDLK